MAEVSVKSVVQSLLERVNTIEESDVNYTQEIADLTDSVKIVVNDLSTIQNDVTEILNNLSSINSTLEDYHDLLYMEVD